MAMGERGKSGDGQGEFWIPTEKLPRSPGHPFYVRLNKLLAAAGFDKFVEDLCRPFYAQDGRPSIPPGTYFRMMLVGYFEGIAGDRGIAWRCADSRSLQQFLGYGATQETPDHSSLSRIRERIPATVHEQAFAFVLGIAHKKNLLDGKTVAVDATLLEANAAMKSIVRKDTGENWKEYLTGLAREAGVENPTAADLATMDRKRDDKKVSNDEWESSSDPDARIAKMKDGTTHLAYKAEHAVDLKSDLIVAATVYPADAPDSATLPLTLAAAQAHLIRAAGADKHTPMPMLDGPAQRSNNAQPTAPKSGRADYTAVAEVTADKGYHKAETLALLEDWGIRTYIPEKKLKHRRVWTDKPAAWRRAHRANRRRARSRRGRRLQRLRSEYAERSFAHVCETGGMRRATLRGWDKVYKRCLGAAMGRNLGVIMRRLFGVGTPRSLQDASAARRAALLCALWAAWDALWSFAALVRHPTAVFRPPDALRRAAGRILTFARRRHRAA